MLTLSLLRHAKSSWVDMELDDFERPLAKRGATAAPLMGQYVAQHKLKPDLVLCSGAVRTRATLALVLPEIGAPPPEIRYDDALYLAPPETILDVLAKAPATAKHVMIVAHNPGLHALALALTGGGERSLIAELATRFPTATLAVLTFDGSDWRRLQPGSGRLTHFMTPKGLRD